MCIRDRSPRALFLKKNACNDFVGLSRRCRADESYIDSLKRSWLKSKTNLKTNFHQLRSLLRRRRATIGIAFSAKTQLLPKITVPELNSYEALWVSQTVSRSNQRMPELQILSQWQLLFLPQFVGKPFGSRIEFSVARQSERNRATDWVHYKRS